MDEQWVPVWERRPPEGVAVDTKIDDSHGVRNVTPLKRSGRLWFFPDGSMYVYYEPTHWKSLTPASTAAPESPR